MRHELINLADTTLFKKMCGPIIEDDHLWVCTKFMCLHIPISLGQLINNNVHVATKDNYYV